MTSDLGSIVFTTFLFHGNGSEVAYRNVLDVRKDVSATTYASDAFVA